jgi:hypothetical protein
MTERREGTVMRVAEVYVDGRLVHPVRSVEPLRCTCPAKLIVKPHEVETARRMVRAQCPVHRHDP